MDFLEAVRESSETGKYIRRPNWADGVAMFIASPSGRKDSRYKFSSQSRGGPYVATCHIAACELGGVRSLKDILANDWELMYPESAV